MPKELRRAPDSTSVWESNMKELERRQPNLALLLKRYVTLYGHDFSHYENQTPAGKWIEGLTGEPFFERGGEPGFNWSRDSGEDKNKPVFILYGTGTPPYLYKAIKALPEAALSLIVAEPNLSLIAYTLHLTHVYQALPENCGITFLTEVEGEGETEEERAESKFMISRVLTEECMNAGLRPVGIYAAALAELSSHEGEADAWGGDFKRLGERMTEWVTVTLTYLGNSAEDTLLGLRQIALMSPAIAFGKPLDIIRGKFPDRPAILVAAGPSLDKNIMQLKAVQDKCLIMAVDAVLAKLLRAGIKPHIVVSLERGANVYDLFFANTVEKFPKECKDILLITQGLSIPWISGRWPGPVCFASKEDAVMDTWFAGGVLGGSVILSGTSVAHMNYILSHYMNLPYVAIIGQDLAYGESGASHAGGVVGGWKARGKDEIEIPGALGGMVKTIPGWLTFLRVLEDYIAKYPRQVWDCTEGGALIAGTKVEPLADFIGRFAANLEPMSLTPASCFRDGGNDIDVRETGEQVLANIARQYEQFGEIERDLDEVERLIESTVAAGLEPARRIAYAARTGNLFDAIHKQSEVFFFIGQSYARHATIELALTRSLDNVETVNRWHAINKEILDSHRAVMAFIRTWFSYTERAIGYWTAKGAMEWGPLEPEIAWEKSRGLFERLEEAEGDDISNIRLELNNVMMRCDPVRLKWPGRVLWNYAMLLMLEGRAAFAARFMNAAAADFDGKEMPVADMVAFFKDYARVLMGRDLVHRPDFFKAEKMLANAVDLNGVDDEIKSILNDIMDVEVAHSAIMDEYQGFAMRGQSLWYADRAIVQKQLYDGDLRGAFASMWGAIKKHWRTMPGWAASHLEWLVQNMEKCADAADPLMSETISMILTDMVKNGEILQSFPIEYKISFVRRLEAKGLRVQWNKPAEEPKAEESAALPETERVGAR